MSNLFIRATASAIDRHGIVATYKVVSEGAYNVNTGTTTNTETSYSIKMYMKQIKANQFNYPTLIGKESGMFYILAYNLAFVPSSNDLITYDGVTYKVDSVQKHNTGSSVVLYKVLAVV